MYQARVTKDGEKRHGIPAGTIVEYESIHPVTAVVQNLVIDGEKTTRFAGFTGDDRTVELITWPADFDYKAVNDVS